MSKKSILIIEDDETLRDTLSYNLSHQGYTTYTAIDGLLGIQLAEEHNPDMIVLDLMLPGIDGIEVCRRLRKKSNVPILMLTAKAEEIDRIVGLEVGADDYMSKPFSMRELQARIKALLRRIQLIREEISASNNHTSKTLAQTEKLIFDNLIFDIGRREVLLNDLPLHLKPKEYELLLFLARNQGIALSRDIILERVWGWTHDGNSRTVDVHIRWLREKIEVDNKTAVRIITVRGTGYRFEG